MKKMIAVILPIILLLSISSTDVAVADTAGTAIPVGISPHHAAFDPKDNFVYVTNGGDNTVSVVNLATNVVVNTVPVGPGPMGIDFDSSNNYVYVADLNGNNVSIIDGDPSHGITYDTVVATTAVGNQPWGVAFDSANGNVYVANSGDGTVSVINGTAVIGSPIAVGTHPSFLAYDSANGDIYVANENSGTVSVISGTAVVGSPIAVGGFPRGITFDSANSDIYVGNNSPPSLSVISGTSVVTTITGTLGGNDLAYDSFNGGIYVVDGGAASVMAINGATNSIAFSVPLSAVPFGLGYDPVNNFIVAVDQSAGNIIPVSTTPFPTVTITSVSNTNPRWGIDPITTSGTVTNAAAGDTVTVHWGDDNSDTGIAISSGSWTSPSHTYSNGGSESITADVVRSSAVVASTSSGTSITVKPHVTALSTTTMNPASPPGVFWGQTFTATAILTVLDSSGEVIASETIKFNDTRTSAPATSGNTDGTGTTPATTVTASGIVTVGPQNVKASFAGDTNYVASSSDTPITILPHVTNIILNTVISPFAGNPFSVNGELDDTDLGNIGIPNEPLTFIASSGVSVPGATTNGVTFSDSLNLQTTPMGSTNVMRLNAGAVLSTPSNPAYVTLFLADMGGSTVTIKVTYGDGSTNTFTSPSIASGTIQAWGLESAGITGSSPPADVGIAQIQIVSVSGGGLAGISEVKTLDSILGQVLDIKFLSPISPTTQTSFNQGEFFAVGTSPSTVSTGLSVKGNFAGDPSYLPIDPTSSKFNTYFSTTSGVGGLETSVPDVGTAITAATCPLGDLLDVDNLCKTWKTTGIPYTYKVGENGATSTGHYPLTGAVVGQKDVYVETDSMTGFNPNAASLTDVQTAFTNNGVNLFIANDEQNLAAVPSLNVWSDTNTDFTK